jgi:class 3 adenylate cyclase
MYEPDTRYARLDGSRIAYQVFGEGPLDLIGCTGLASMDAEWEEPEIAHFNRQLGDICRSIRFDDLGSGSSDPYPPDAGPPERHSSRQIMAVLDAAGSERAILFAGDSGTPGALVTAAEHPDRVAGLIVFQGSARVVAADDYPDGMPAEELDRWADMYDTMDVDRILQSTAPSRAGDEQFMRWGRKWLRNMASPAVVRELIMQAKDLDVRWALERIRVPTMVMHRTDFQATPMATSKYLADHIPGARFVEVPGSDGPPWFDHPDAILTEIRGFVETIAGDFERTSRTERVMAAVLFTDLVSSTRRAQEVGDARWRSLLQLHEDVSQRCIGDAGGRLIKTTGDGVLATFDGPGAAIRCAAAMSRNLDRLGLPIRAGIHTGEVETRGEDVGGIGVHIAARVMANAGAGEVLVSRTVRDLVVGSEFAFESRGVHELKGIDGDWELFALRP